MKLNEDRKSTGYKMRITITSDGKFIILESENQAERSQLKDISYKLNYQKVTNLINRLENISLYIGIGDFDKNLLENDLFPLNPLNIRK